MRILLCGDDQPGLVALACDLTRADSTLIVAVLVAGVTRSSKFKVVMSEEAGIVVTRVERADLHPTHWHKSVSADVRESFRSLLTESSFDLVHVLAWRGLTRDLVATAHTLGVPAVVTLVDDWATCLLKQRVRSTSAGGGEACTERHSVTACVPCARSTKPETPWVQIEQEFLGFAERLNAIKSELLLARAIFVDSEEFARCSRRLGDALVDREVVVARKADLTVLVETYKLVVTEDGSDGNEASESVWYEERMQKFAEQEWDKHCREAEA